MITATGLKKLGFTPETDFVLQDNSDGPLMENGLPSPNPFIAEWKSAQPQPSEAEIETAHAEWQAEYDAQEYARLRETAYAPIGDQLDMQYWDNANGTTTWADHVAEIKARFPK